MLGQTVYRQLFGGDQNPIGAMILVKGVPLRVIGVLAAKGQTAFGQDQDDRRDDSVHDRRAQSAGRRRAEPAADADQLAPIRRRPILTACSRG